VNKERQMLCFSATISSKVKKLAYRYMTHPKEITVKKEKVTLENIDQRVIKTSMRWKQEALFKELDEKRPFLSIIFCRTQRRVNELEEAMTIAGYNCARLHGGMKQSKRQRVMRNFKSADLQYLIATDVAARGIDVKNITHIYNYDFPESPEVYIHRIGRTGRMGEAGEAISLVAPREEETLQATEKKIKMKIPKTTYKK
jgi:superfamily II DNA/RNA helicase